jgi:hypothetical protein
VAELLLAVALALLARELKVPPPAAGKLSGSRLQGPVLLIEGTSPALLTPAELRRHALPVAEVADACFLAGPGALGELPRQSRLCLHDAYRAGLVRGVEVSQLAGGTRALEHGEALIFVLLNNTTQGSRVHAFVSAVPTPL